MCPHILNTDVGSLFDAVLGDTTGELYLVNPSRKLIETVIPALASTSDVSLHLLAGEHRLKAVLDDFIVGSTAADLIDTDRLALRTYDGSTNTLMVLSERVIAIVPVEELVAGLGTDDEAFVAAVREKYDNKWASAEPFTLRTPSISRIRSTLTEEIGPDMVSDFGGVLSALEAARGDGDGLDEVTIILLVAAKNEELLYEISRWGEDVGVASKATFSRTKRRLEELGLIETEKVPVDIGRPRLRLLLGHERLQGTAPDELANTAQSLLVS